MISLFFLWAMWGTKADSDYIETDTGFALLGASVDFQILITVLWWLS